MEPYDFVFLLSRYSRIDILIQIRNSVQRYWRFYFLLLLNTSCVKVVGSPSLLRFVKRDPAKKFPIELDPIKKKPQQIKLRPKSNPKPLRPRNKPTVTAPLIPSENIPPPPRRPRSSYSLTSDLSHYIGPENIISSSLDKRSPEFRVAHLRYFQKLKQESVLMLDKASYHTTNASSLEIAKISIVVHCIRARFRKDCWKRRI